MPEQHQRIVHVYLTAAQAEYLKQDEADLVITMVDDRGGIFVEQASCAGDEGSGVWVDAVGQEHHGPGGSFVRSKDATESSPFAVDAYGAWVGTVLSASEAALASGSMGEGAEEATVRAIQALLKQRDPAIA